MRPSEAARVPRLASFVYPLYKADTRTVRVRVRVRVRVVSTPRRCGTHFAPRSPLIQSQESRCFRLRHFSLY